MGAEIDSMRVSEQIDAMEVYGIYPFKYLVETRISATALMLTLLIIFGDAAAFKQVALRLINDTNIGSNLNKNLRVYSIG
jgi:phospholipid/cholesterol/gamma-HCH transport system permease protein